MSKAKTKVEQVIGNVFGVNRIGGARFIDHGKVNTVVSKRAKKRAGKVKRLRAKAKPIDNARSLLDTFQQNGIVRYPGPQLKADQAFRELAQFLSTDEYTSLRSARGCVLDNAGHRASEFNDACEAVRARWNREDLL